jgi:hypothetical protein
MSAYVVIQTLFQTYKCHDFRLKNSRVYFNGRAVNLGNVVRITAKDGSIPYANDKLSVVTPKRVAVHHVSALKGADKCKATVKPRSISKMGCKNVNNSKPKSSTLPDVIEI